MDARVLKTLLCLAICLAAGCRELDLQLPAFRDEQEVRRANVNEAIRGEDGHSRLIGDYIQVSGLNMPVLEGVGLVVGLDGTGDDPPASYLRTELLEDMRRREVKDPNQWLRRPDTTLVVVRAYIPPLIRKQDTFDVEIYLPPGSEATSLRGGKLMECNLMEKALVAGRGVLDGKRLAIASGFILVDGDAEEGTGTVLRGRIPGGAVYAGDNRNLAIHLRPDYRSVRMSQRIAARIGQRFHDYDEYGIKRPLAEAKTDSRIELVVHSRYRDNYPRYLQCIRHIMLSESQVERHMRLERLEDELWRVSTSGAAALELEAMGTEAAPLLREALASEELIVRFHAAQALAYLGHSDGAAALGEAADREPALRIHALAALSALRSGEAAIALRELLDHSSMETRYGAVRALATLDPRDPAIAGEEFDQGFTLRVVRSAGEPMVHVTRRKEAEIVLFGADQRFQTPLLLSAGRRFMIRAEPGQESVTVTRFTPGRDVDRQVVPSRIADVIVTLAEMEATYADVLQMLTEAERQHNLPGPIGIDELPRPGRVYNGADRQLAAGDEAEERHASTDDASPNLFDDPDATPDPETAPPDDAELGPVGFVVE